MNRKVNLINNILYFAITICLLILTVVLTNGKYKGEKQTLVALYMVIDAIISGFFITLFHELGHLIVGKKNGFYLLSFTVWCFKWTRVKEKLEFSFTFLGEEAGSTEMVSKRKEDLANRYKKMTLGGSIFTFVLMILGIIPYFISGINVVLHCFWAMFLPIGAYTFFGNFLPMVNGGIKNDGAVYFSFRAQDDYSKVTTNLLAIQSDLFNGLTPSQIDKELYFNLPQLPEDDFNFLVLLNARYNYYLDGGDFENAIKVQNRAMDILEYMPKSVSLVVKTDSLYNACAIDKNEDLADDLMYELEKYLNKFNTATNIRVKMAYICNVIGEKDNLETFYAKGKKEALKSPIKGQGLFEIKLMDEIMKAVRE